MANLLQVNISKWQTHIFFSEMMPAPGENSSHLEEL